MIANSIVLFAVASLLCQTAHAHFTITGPAFSREKQAYPNDNRRFWPIAGGATLRPEKDCLLFPRGQVASLTAGQALTVPFEIGNNARHVGMCTAALINLSSGASTDLGQELNCVHDHDAMQLQLPQGQACANCVIKIKVTAVHLGPDHPEFYDSCLDVNVGGGSGGDAPAPAPAKPKPPVTPPNLNNPAPVPAPAPAPSPPTDGNGDDNGGDDGNGDDNGGDDDNNGGDDGNGGDNSQQPSTPAQPSTGNGGSCQDGAMSCSADGTQFIQCSNGQQIAQNVAPGTECTTKLTGSPIIAFKGQ